MVSAVAASFAVLSLAITALELFSFLDPQSGTGTTPPAQDSLLHSAAEVLPPLAAAGALFLSIAVIHHHLMRHAAVPVAGAGNRRPSAGLVIFVLCVSAGMLEFILVPQDAGGADHGAQALRALGLAAFRALPAVATATFFSGMMVIIAHVRAGGEGGGGAAVAGDGPIQGPVRLITKVALGAAVALVFLMVIALCAAK